MPLWHIHNPFKGFLGEICKITGVKDSVSHAMMGESSAGSVLKQDY